MLVISLNQIVGMFKVLFPFLLAAEFGEVQILPVEVLHSHSEDIGINILKGVSLGLSFDELAIERSPQNARILADIPSTSS